MSLKFKRHYAVLLILIAVLAFITLALGSQRVIAYTTHASSTAHGWLTWQLPCRCTRQATPLSP